MLTGGIIYLTLWRKRERKVIEETESRAKRETGKNKRQVKMERKRN